MISNQGTVLKITAQDPAMPMTAEVIAQKNIVSCTWKVEDANHVTKAIGEALVSGTSAQISAHISAQMWTVAHPVLYHFFADLTFSDNTTESIRDCFGYRFFSADEQHLYLNGYPFYMRAYIRGAAAHEHQNNCNLSEYDFYKKNILTAKQYGFNTIRFHSVIPPEACFRAADDLGILIHIEMRAEGLDYNNLEEMLHGKNDFVSNEELLQTIHTLYNHPSFMVYCVGNEIRHPGHKPRIREIRDFIKKHDPTRLFIDTCAHGEYDRDYVDFDVQHMGYFFPYGKHADMFENTDNLLCFGTVKNRDMVSENQNSKIKRAIAFDRPMIAHEVCHYTSWRDFYALKEKFSKYGHTAPWWIDEEIKMLEAKGYQKHFKEYLQITKDYQFRCWKTAFEGIRASHLLSGFHMLQFADTDKYENSNGVVDCFDDAHGISPENFRVFNADTVLLARLPKQIWRTGEQVQIPVLLSQFMISPPKSAQFSYRVTDHGEPCFDGILTDVDTQNSGIYKICTLEFTLPEDFASKKLLLSCQLDFDDGSVCKNQWEFWVFPAYQKLTLDARHGMRASYLDRVCTFTPSSSLLLTDQLNDALFDELERGGDVMLLYRTDWTRHLLHKEMPAPQYAFRHTWDRFKGVIWDRGTINGGYDAADILREHGFVTDGQINFQYYPLIDDSDKINLDDFPIPVTSLVSGLDKSSRDRFDPAKFGLSELMYDRTMRHFSYAFALRVGKGRLLVTGFNFTGISNLEPASGAMLKALVSYCHSADFSPEACISVSDLKDYLWKTAASGPQKERMMTQYWQLDAEPVESEAYWIESERYLREDEGK